MRLQRLYKRAPTYCMSNGRQHFLLCVSLVRCRRRARATRTEKRKWEKRPVGWYLKNDMTLLFCSQQQGASRSFTSTRNTHTQLTGHRQTRNLCFYGRTEGPVCVLSSCLANTQLYMADTEREGLAGEPVFVLWCGVSVCSSDLLWFLSL